MGDTARNEIWFIIQDDENSSDAQRARNLSAGWQHFKPVFIYHQAGGPRQKQIWGMIGRKRPPVVYCFSYNYFIVFLALWCRLFWPGVKFVFDTGDLAYKLRRLFAPAKSQALLQGIYELLILRFADMIVVRGHWHKEYLEKRGHRNVILMPDGVHLNKIKEQDSSALKKKLFGSGAFVVGLVGFMSWLSRLGVVWYGWDLLEAARLLKDTPIKFAMAGFGPGKAEFLRKVKEYGLESSVIFMGLMPKEKTSEWLSMFDVVLNTQPNDEAFWVRTTGKMPLYLAANRYILTSDVGEAHYILPKEMLIPYHGLVDPGYPARLAARIEKLYRNRNLLDVRAGGRELAARYFAYSKLSVALEKRLDSFLCEAKSDSRPEKNRRVASEVSFACPVCRGKLDKGKNSYSCRNCNREYRVVSGLPLLLDANKHQEYLRFYQDDSERINHFNLDRIPFFAVKLKKAVDMAASAGIPNDSPVLDAGCGDGVLLKLLREAGFNNVWGADISPARASKALSANGGKQVVATDLENPGFGPDSFKAIIASEILEHVPDPPAFLSACHKMLCSGGVLVVTVPSASRWADWPYRLTRGRKSPDFTKDPGHLRFLSRPELFRLCEQAGFKKSSCASTSLLPGRAWEVLDVRCPGFYRLFENYSQKFPVINQGGSFLVAQFIKKPAVSEYD
jgi:2-polyprenyl-3-methyl-5-hydroxy-6-metoxy-1,4-benzoquinol methylase/glycosyltransferase involved in cell wall biosynthesis